MSDHKYVTRGPFKYVRTGETPIVAEKEATFYHKWDTDVIGDFVSPTSYKRGNELFSHHVGTRIYRNGTFETVTTGIIDTAPTVVDVPNYTVAYNKALSDMNEQLRGNLDLSIDLIQHQQTKRMVGGLGNMVQSLMAVARKIKKLQLKGASKDASELWLQYVYGWKPTASSLCDLYKEATSTPPKQGWLKLKGSGSSSAEPIPYLRGKTNGSVLTRARVRCLIAPLPTVLNQMGRISSINPISIAYEMIPFSFVVDWIFDFGSYLRELETAFLHGSDFISGSVSMSWKYVASNVIVENLLTGSILNMQMSTSFNRVTRFERTVLSSYPLPRRPVFELDLGVSRVLSAASLLRLFIIK